MDAVTQDVLSMRVTVRDDLTTRTVGDETVLLQLSEGRYFVLNDSAAEMLSALQRGGPLSSVLAQMVEEFDVSREVLRRDLLDFIALLAHHRLVTPVDG